jgi:hypothetical protein
MLLLLRQMAPENAMMNHSTVRMMREKRSFPSRVLYYLSVDSFISLYPTIQLSTNHFEVDIPGHIDIPSSDEIPDQLMISPSESAHSPTIEFPVSDDDAMDVVKSDKHSAPLTRIDTESGAGSNITFPESDFPDSDFPVLATGGSGKMPRFVHDPHMDLYTVSPFAKFPDDLFD